MAPTLLYIMVHHVLGLEALYFESYQAALIKDGLDLSSFLRLRNRNFLRKSRDTVLFACSS